MARGAGAGGGGCRLRLARLRHGAAGAGGAGERAGFDAGRQAALEALLARAARAFALAGLRRLGWTPRIGETVEANALRVALGVLPEHARLFARLLGLLGEAGLLSAAGEDSWQVIKASWRTRRRRWPRRRRPRVSMKRLPGCCCRAAGRHWRRCCAGATPPLGLLFPEQGVGAADLYSAAPMSKLMNGLLAASVQRMVAGLPAGRRLRVLEVGAGTGGATSAVLPLLPAERTTYVYTDVSAGFFGAAERRFAAYPFVDYRVLDVERDPAGQGFAAGGYDLVLASNVVHATRDLVATASHCRGLLAPGGDAGAAGGDAAARLGRSDVRAAGGLVAVHRRDAAPQHALLDATGWRSGAGCGRVCRGGVAAAGCGAGAGRGAGALALWRVGRAGLWVLAADGRGRRIDLPRDLRRAGSGSYWPGPGPSLCARTRGSRSQGSRLALRMGEAGTGGRFCQACRRSRRFEAWCIWRRWTGRWPGPGTPRRSVWLRTRKLRRGERWRLAQALMGHGASPTSGFWLVTEGAQVVSGRAGRTSCGGGALGDGSDAVARTPGAERAPARPRCRDAAWMRLSMNCWRRTARTRWPGAVGMRLAPRLVRAGSEAERLALPSESGWRLAKGSERTLAGLAHRAGRACASWPWGGAGVGGGGGTELPRCAGHAWAWCRSMRARSGSSLPAG